MAGAVQTFATMCPMNCHPTLCGMLSCAFLAPSASLELSFLLSSFCAFRPRPVGAGNGRAAYRRTRDQALQAKAGDRRALRPSRH